ncbi:MAG: maleylacetoacetate isomerase [Pseudomonadota bacterium]
MSGYILYDFPRASSAYRVRIAMGLKGIAYATKTVNFREDAQHSEEYQTVNPAGLVPALETPDGQLLTQSLAIIGYLDRIDGPRLYPEQPFSRAVVDSMALTIACDIHPLNNLRVLKYLEHDLSCDEDARMRWYAEWVTRGFSALEKLVQKYGGQYCFEDEISTADICLIPQVYNASRFDVPLEKFPALLDRAERLKAVPSFQNAHPEFAR